MAKMKKNVTKEAAKPPKLPLTVAEACELWGLKPTRVKQLCEQGRVKHEKRGGGPTRAATILIMQLERPEKLAPGELKRAAK